MFFHLDKYTEPHPSSSALITIDLQNDFCLPGAPAEGMGALDAAVWASRMASFYRALNLPIFHIVRLYSLGEEGKYVDACRRKAMQENELHMLIPGSNGTQLVDGLAPAGTRLDSTLLFSKAPQDISDKECILYKPRWGAFHETGLDTLLKQHRISTLVIAGTWFSNCVRTTIYEATSRDYRVVALRDAIAGMYPRGEEDLYKIKCGICSCSEWEAHVRANG